MSNKTNDKLQKSVEIFKKLGWENATPENLFTLPLGTKEEQKTALDGLKKGEFGEWGIISENTFGFIKYVDVDLNYLGFFAVRLGVDAKRAYQLLFDSRNLNISLALIDEKGADFALQFINEAYKKVSRIWEHSSTALGEIIVPMIMKYSLPIPESIDYIKDWAVCTAKLFNIKMHSAECAEIEHFTLDDIAKTAERHLEIATDTNAPITGFLKDIIPLLVERSFVSREKTIELLFISLCNAIRPGDRKTAIDLLEKLSASDDEFTKRTQSLIPLLSLGENPITSKIAPILIQSCDDYILPEVMMSALTVKAKSGKVSVLKSALDRKAPKDAGDLSDWISMLISDSDKSISKSASKLAEKWNLSTAIEKNDTDLEIRGLWKETPPIWECPKVDIENYTFEDLTDLLSELMNRRSTVHDIVTEKFLALAVKLAFIDEKETRMSLSGVKKRDSFEIHLYQWVKNKDRIRKWNRQEPLWYLYARDECVLWNLGTIPCLLSAPSYEDLSVTVSDLASRLKQYHDNKISVLEGDLLLALTRLDVNTTSPELETLIMSMNSSVLLKDDKKMKKTASQIVLDYIKYPFEEPNINDNPEKVWSPYKDLEMDAHKSLQDFPPRHKGYPDEPFSVFPLFGDVALKDIRDNYSEVYHELGLYMKQVARRKKPLPKGGTVNFFAAQRKPTSTTADDIMTATFEAWERGLLRPKVASLKFMDWSDSPPHNIAALAQCFETYIEEGMLSVIWNILDEIILVSLDEVRLPAGTAEIAILIEKYLPEVKSAISKGLTDESSINLLGIRKLAEKKGNSNAVVTAQKIVKELPQTSELFEDKNIDTPDISDFDTIWKKRKKDYYINDNSEVYISRITVKENKNLLMVELILPNEPDTVYQIIKSDWLYDICSEHTCQATKKPLHEKGQFIDGYSNCYLHYDDDKKTIVSDENRDFINKKDAPLRGKSPKLTSSLLTVLFVAFSQKGMYEYLVKAMLKESLLINETSTRHTTIELLKHPDVNIGKTINLLETDKQYLPELYPVLAESIKFVSEQVKNGENPPKWFNRILDCVLRYAPYLNEAIKRNLISKDQFSGLVDLKNMKKKSTVKTKAETLCDIFGI